MAITILKRAGMARGVAAAGVAAGLLALALRFHLYAEGARSIPVTTDEALTVLQAVDIRHGDFPLLLAAQPYMFPLEAYWMAPLVHWLPRTAWGMRALILAEGLAFLGLSLLLLRQMGGRRATWPGGLLALSTPQNRLGHIPVNAQHRREYSLDELLALVRPHFAVEAVIGVKQGRIVFPGDPFGQNTMLLCRRPAPEAVESRKP